MIPDLSVVVVGRNDGYGGDFRKRMQYSVDALLSLSEQVGLRVELVVVEWNPPQSRERLSDALAWPDGRTGSVRIVEVPKSVHQQFTNAEEMPVFEYVAKNVGIRRATGDYILCTNPDIIFNEELLAFFADEDLSPDCFYRMGKFNVDTVPESMHTVDDVLDHCRNTVRDVAVMNQGYVDPDVVPPYERKATGIQHVTTPASIDEVFMQAAGDFLLMSEGAWNEIRGYPELGSNLHVDAMGCLLAAGHGLDQVILCDPLRIYHQTHDRDAREGRPKMSHERLIEVGNRLLSPDEENQEGIRNDSTWGLQDEDLPETTVL